MDDEMADYFLNELKFPYSLDLDWSALHEISQNLITTPGQWANIHIGPKGEGWICLSTPGDRGLTYRFKQPEHVFEFKMRFG